MKAEAEAEEKQKMEMEQKMDPTSTAVITPKQTLYVKNLNEKIHPEKMKLLLYTIFSRFGSVLDVICKRSMRLRGQAWIVFEEVKEAVKAREKLNGKKMCEKELQIHFAKSQSDASKFREREMPSFRFTSASAVAASKLFQ